MANKSFDVIAKRHRLGLGFHPWVLFLVATFAHLALDKVMA
jgi:hypothetical protein